MQVVTIEKSSGIRLWLGDLDTYLAQHEPLNFTVWNDIRETLLKGEAYVTGDCNAVIEVWSAAFAPDSIPMDNETYAETHHGCRCPRCGSPSIGFQGKQENFGDSIYQEMACDSCGARWADSYMLTGYVLHTPGDKEAGGQQRLFAGVSNG